MTNPPLKLNWTLILQKEKEAAPPEEVDVIRPASEEGSGPWGYLSDQRLHEMIDRCLGHIRSGLAEKLPNKGAKLRITLHQLQGELESRKLVKCRKIKEDAKESAEPGRFKTTQSSGVFHDSPRDSSPTCMPKESCSKSAFASLFSKKMESRLVRTVLFPAKEAASPEEVDVIRPTAEEGGGQWGHLSDQRLHEMIDRYLGQIRSGLAEKLPDKGAMLRINLHQLHGELESRKLVKCRKRKQDVEESAEPGRFKTTQSSGVFHDSPRDSSPTCMPKESCSKSAFASLFSKKMESRLVRTVLFPAKEAASPEEVDVIRPTAEEGGGQWGHLSDQRLHEMIDRYLGQIRSGLAEKLPDKGAMLRINLHQLHGELESRKLVKCRKRKQDVEESAEPGRFKTTQSSGVFHDSPRDSSPTCMPKESCSKSAFASLFSKKMESRLVRTVLFPAKEAAPPEEVDVIRPTAEEGGGQWGHLSDQRLHEMIDRYLGQIRSGLAEKLPDKGAMLRINLHQLHGELESRKLVKCRKRKQDVEESAEPGRFKTTQSSGVFHDSPRDSSPTCMPKESCSKSAFASLFSKKMESRLVRTVLFPAKEAAPPEEVDVIRPTAEEGGGQWGHLSDQRLHEMIDRYLGQIRSGLAEKLLDKGAMLRINLHRLHGELESRKLVKCRKRKEDTEESVEPGRFKTTQSSGVFHDSPCDSSPSCMPKESCSKSAFASLFSKKMESRLDWTVLFPAKEAAPPEEVDVIRPTAEEGGRQWGHLSDQRLHEMIDRYLGQIRSGLAEKLRDKGAMLRINLHQLHGELESRKLVKCRKRKEDAEESAEPGRFKTTQSSGVFHDSPRDSSPSCMPKESCSKSAFASLFSKKMESRSHLFSIGGWRSNGKVKCRSSKKSGKQLHEIKRPFTTSSKPVGTSSRSSTFLGANKISP